MPFVALYMYENADEDEDGRKKELLLIFLSSSLAVWLILNILFFCTIDLSYVNTFIGIKTGPQHTCERFNKMGESDETKFGVVFGSSLSYTKSIRGEVRTWVAENIAGWIEEKPEWFNIDFIPNDMLPEDVLES